MDTRRLRHLHDICPLYTSGALPSYEATRWAQEGMRGSETTVSLKNGTTALVFKNPLFTWHRSFTTDNEQPPKPSIKGSLFQIEEWVPSFENALNKKGWFTFGIPRRQAIAPIPAEDEVSANWSSHAKRHLKAFHKQGEVKLRLGTLDELKKPYSRSLIHASMRESLFAMTKRHVTAHQDTIEVLIAETEKDGIIAAFVAGHCLEASQSIYLLGFYLPPAAKTYAMTGLVEWWFKRARAKGLTLCNFGDIVGPHPSPFNKERGYSIFKTHFGIRRVHLPRSYWRFSFGRRSRE
jgi:hypothetical protein